MAATVDGSSSALPLSWPPLALLAAAVVLLLALAGCLLPRRSRPPQVRSEELEEIAMPHTEPDNPTWVDAALLSLRVDASALQDAKALDYSDLWLVRHRDGRLLVSRRLPAHDATAERVIGFAADITILSSLQHENIVALVGVAWTNAIDLQALSEYVDGGDLYSFLASSRLRTPWSSTKLKMAVGVAQALAYAHSLQPPVIHGQPKAHNVLLSRDLQPKLSDFAVAPRHSRVQSVMAAMPSRRWTAPEVLRFVAESDERSDVYGFGWVLAELDSHQVPFYKPGEYIEGPRVWRLIIKGDLRLDVSSDCPSTVWGLMARCLSLSPELRPSAAECVAELQEALAGMTS